MDYTSISGTRKSHQMHVFLIRGETNHLPIKSSILSKKKKKSILSCFSSTPFFNDPVTPKGLKKIKFKIYWVSLWW